MKSILERSLTQTERTLPDAEPLSAMVATVAAGRNLVFRIGLPFVLVTMFSALLAWGYTGQTAPRIPKSALPAASAQFDMTPVSLPTDEPAPVGRIASEPRENPARPLDQLSLQQARKIAARFANGVINDLEIVDTDQGPAIVVVNSQRKAGNTNFLLLQRRDGKYRLTAQGRLDTNGFRHALWNSELIDADQDGFQELIFNGRESSEGRNLRRLVLFVPNEKRTYSMQMTGQTTSSGSPHIQWLSNAAGTDAAAYRTALRQKARSVVAKKR